MLDALQIACITSGFNPERVEKPFGVRFKCLLRATQQRKLIALKSLFQMNIIYEPN